MFCPNCGTYNQDEAEVCISCQYALNAAPEGAGEAIHAGFIERLAALFIDNLLLGLATLVLFAIAGIVLALTGVYKHDNSDAPFVIGLLAYLLAFVISALYFTLMESGEKGATLGKRLMKIRVVDMEGNRISKSRALGRWFAHFLSNISFCIGYIIQPFTQKKQALHDMVSGTLELRTSRQGSSNAVVAVVIMVGMIPFFFAITGIVAAVAIPAYQDYIVKAGLVKAESVGRSASMAVERYYRKTGRIPANLAQTHFHLKRSYEIESVTVNPKNAVVKVTFSDHLEGDRLAGKSLVFTPSQDANGRITWQCSSPDIKQHNLLPKDCR